MTSSKPILISSPKIEPAEDYDEDDDDLDEEDEDDYYAQPEKLEAKSSKIPTTTEMPEDTTLRFKHEDTTIKIFAQKTAGQKQVTTLINPDKNVRLVQTQNGRTIKYPPTYETKIEQKMKKNEDKSQMSAHYETEDSNPQDITISKTTQKIKYKTRYLPSKTTETKNNIDEEDESGKKNLKPDSYVSVTNSLTGSVNDNQENGKFSSTYYTKSSSCGHFTFTCNTVYGSEGRSKICRPKQSNQKC